MKARVIETGKIEEFQVNELNDYFTKDGVHYKGLELDFEDVEPDYWEKLKHQYAGMAMQGMLSNSAYMENFVRYAGQGESLVGVTTQNAFDYATTLVNKLKEEQK